MCCTKEKRNAYEGLVRTPQGQNSLENLSVNGNAMLKQAFIKLDYRSRTNLLGSEQGRVGSFCEHGNEPDAKCEEFLH